MSETLTKRVEALEADMEALRNAMSSGDPLGAMQRTLINQRATKLAEVNNPKDLTSEKIQEISGDDGSDDAENSANRDVAEQLKEQKAEASSTSKKKTQTPARQPGEGGARG